ncbi:hypothetical protein [Haladaptatus sp. GCM10025893]|uniref:hypothetical protein n=1 Tax=Haladaptatus sp. GCM10025893 TaxID=3252659 RepID=UPI00361C4D70
MPELEPIADIHDRIENEKIFPEDVKEEFKQFVSNNYYDVEFGAGSVNLDNFLVKGFNNLSEAEVNFGGSDYIVYGKNAQERRLSLERSSTISWVFQSTNRSTG